MKITIPSPCHENWNEMVPEEKGRFCSVCSKVVKDFTNSSNKEILDILESSEEKICGNFKQAQLNKNLHYSYINALFAKFAVGFVITTAGIITIKAQNCEAKKDSIKEKNVKGEVLVSKDLKIIPIKDNNQIILGGVHSYKSTENPLIIVNDKEFPFEQFKNLNPKKIKTIEVVKGTKAIDMYGEKAKFGVIIVKTKK